MISEWYIPGEDGVLRYYPLFWLWHLWIFDFWLWDPKDRHFGFITIK